MGEHLEVWQVAEFILGGLDDNELEAVCLHFDECADCLDWLAGVIRVMPGQVRPRLDLTLRRSGAPWG